MFTPILLALKWVVVNGRFRQFIPPPQMGWDGIPPCSTNPALCFVFMKYYPPESIRHVGDNGDGKYILSVAVGVVYIHTFSPIVKHSRKQRIGFYANSELAYGM